MSALIVTSTQDYYPFGMLMPGRRGAQVGGGWAEGGSGGSGVPQSLSVERRDAAVGAYKASQEITFEPGFGSSAGDAFLAEITQSSGTGGSGGFSTAGGGYRYGFNGKEWDNEIKGEGSQQDYGMRIYDPRLGKFLSVDPITREYPMLTPYQFASNRPVDGVDLDGLEWSKAAKNLWKGVKDSYNQTKESLSGPALRKTANNVIGTLSDASSMALGKKGAAQKFTRRVAKFSFGFSNSISEPLVFLSTMHNRTLDQNAYGIGFYGFQVGLAVLPEVWAEATSAKSGMAASYEGNRIIMNAINDGVEIRIARRGTEELRYMNARNQAAAYATDLNNPAGIITLREGFGRADILEEAIHHQQRKLHGEDQFNANVLRFEIEAQDKLLNIGTRENWSKSELDKIRGAKKAYEKMQKQKR